MLTFGKFGLRIWRDYLYSFCRFSVGLNSFQNKKLKIKLYMFWKADFQDKGSESDQSGLECLSSFWLAVWPWASYLDYVSLDFLMNKTGRLIPTSQVEVRMIFSHCVQSSLHHAGQLLSLAQKVSQGVGRDAPSTCSLIGWQGFYVSCMFGALPTHLASLEDHVVSSNFVFKILLHRKMNE